jgi:hypothetical protein
MEELRRMEFDVLRPWRVNNPRGDSRTIKGLRDHIFTV